MIFLQPSPVNTDQLLPALVGALRHGVRSCISCAFDDLPAVGRFLAANRFRDVVDLVVHGQELEAIEQIARSESVSSASQTLVISGGEDLHEEDSILLRRAFSDCKTVNLVRQSEGSTNVYCAFAHLADSRAGPLPLPFFVKFDRVDHVKRELSNYRECTTLYIPFNQRPNVDTDRCALGRERGVIVGNFVEQSESLQSVVDRGGGRTALHSLFESALAGWRRQAYYDKERYTSEGSILTHLELACPSRYSLNRKGTLERRHRALAQQNPDLLPAPELEQRIRALPAIKYRWSLSHGDLHGENVRVAGNDAILIDFASVAEGPLSVDPAALDVSLMMGTTLPSGNSWDALASRIYALDALRGPHVPPRPEEAGANLLNAIHFIRQTGTAGKIDEREYPLVIAVQLLRKASYEGRNPEQRRRRDLAYALANQIICGI